MVLLNSTLVETQYADAYTIPATEIAEELGSGLVVNMVMLGGLTKLLPKIYYPTVLKEIENNFEGSAVTRNQRAYETGYAYMAEVLQKKKEAQSKVKE